MGLTDEDKLYADLWVKQSDILMKLMGLVPVAELGIAASWYALMSSGHPRTAHWVAFVGVMIMAAAFIILRRTSDYIGHFRDKITHLLPASDQRLLTGRNVGKFIPILGGIINLILMFITIHPTR